MNNQSRIVIIELCPLFCSNLDALESKTKKDWLDFGFGLFCIRNKKYWLIDWFIGPMLFFSFPPYYLFFFARKISLNLFLFFDFVLIRFEILADSTITNDSSSKFTLEPNSADQMVRFACFTLLFDVYLIPRMLEYSWKCLLDWSEIRILFLFPSIKSRL